MAEKTFTVDGIKYTVMFGHCVLTSGWISDGEKLIGTGTKRTYDENGKLVSVETELTGLVLHGYGNG